MMTQMLMAAAGGINAILPDTITGSDFETFSDVHNPVYGESSLVLSSAGTWQTTGNGTTQSGTWIDGVNPNTAYEVRLTPTSGTPTSGPATGTWHALSTTRTWTLTSMGATLVATLEIRAASGGTILDTSTVTLSVSSEYNGGQ